MFNKRVTVAGHLCLDIIPTFNGQITDWHELISPGALTNVGKPILSTGGAVSNTGLSLYKLGVPTDLMGKVGDDYFGQTILQMLGTVNKQLTKKMIISKGESSSYTIVISPPNTDRMFFHSAGVNDTFTAKDIDVDRLKETDLFHFGYPPLMKSMYKDRGNELVEIFKQVKNFGITTSLDMAQPDPNSASGEIDWKHILKKVLPYVDVFHPSLDEIVYMLRRDSYDKLKHETSGFHFVHSDFLRDISDELLMMGAGIVNVKLGANGLYVKTAKDEARINSLGKSKPYNLELWVDREVYTPCYKVELKGTTGAGDATIAGFISGFIQGQPIEKVVKLAVAVGACSVEEADSLSGIIGMDVIKHRMDQNWEVLDSNINLDNWNFNQLTNVWSGPNDKHIILE